MDKVAKTISFKALGAGKAIDDAQLAAINKFSLVPLATDQVYVRRYLMAHNAIDRDVERFNEDLLEDFARTLPGKGFFVEGHPSSWSGTGGPGKGRFFAAATEEMTPDQFASLTGETARLPDGITSVKVLWGDAYLLRLDSNKDTIANIDGGVYAFVSIGFKAPYFDVTDERGGFIYGEYRPKGEALEGSLVWLGAQPGAGARKQAGGERHPSTPAYNGNQKGGTPMKELLEKLRKVFNKTFTEESLVDEIKTMIEEKDMTIKDLKGPAADGKVYRKHLVEDAVRFGAMVEEIPTDADAQKKEAEFLEGLSIDRLKFMRDKYEAKAREKFPDKFTFQGKDQTDRLHKEADEKSRQATTAKKDLTDPSQNELFKTLGR